MAYDLLDIKQDIYTWVNILLCLGCCSFALPGQCAVLSIPFLHTHLCCICVLVLFFQVTGQPALGIQKREKCYWTKMMSSGFSSDICTLQMSLSESVTTTWVYLSYRHMIGTHCHPSWSFAFTWFYFTTSKHTAYIHALCIYCILYLANEWK